MTKPSTMARLRARIPGFPWTTREALSSLQVLATLRAQGWQPGIGTEARTTVFGLDFNAWLIPGAIPIARQGRR